MASLQSEHGGKSEKNIIIISPTLSFYWNLMLVACAEKILFNEVYGFRIPGSLEANAVKYGVHGHMHLSCVSTHHIRFFFFIGGEFLQGSEN